jgi:hypothetical protein
MTTEAVQAAMRPEAQSDSNRAGLLGEWKEAQRLFRNVAEKTPARMISGGGWDRCVRIWDDFDRIIEYIEKSSQNSNQTTA